MDFSLSKRDTSLVKGIAICLMLWHHLFCQHPEFGHVEYGIAGVAKVCVALFVMISGYGLAVSYPQRSDRFDIKMNFKFLLHRLTKFYINYWAVFIIVVPVGILLGRSLVTAYINTDAAVNFTIYEKTFGNNIAALLIADFFGVLRYRSYNITWWFNQLIIVLYLLFPLLFHLAKHNLKIVMIVSFLCMVLFSSSYFAYGFIFLVGLVLGQNNRILKNVSEQHIFFLSKINLLIILCVLLLVLMICRTFPISPRLGGINIDAFISINIICIIILTLRKPNWISKLISYLGGHSMNIYMVHTFIFSYFFKVFIYSFRYPLIIFLVLLTTSLMVSICIEFLKRKLCFYRLQSIIINKIQNI